jgi:hypothetical protein
LIHVKRRTRCYTTVAAMPIMKRIISHNIAKGRQSFLFSLQCSNLSWDADLQIIHADVLLCVDGEVLIDEPLCIDVGLPALMYSVNEDVEPNRWAAPEEYDRMPFFCCGCGDPECRAYSFRVRHIDVSHLELAELEERDGGKPKVVAAGGI